MDLPKVVCKLMPAFSLLFSKLHLPCFSALLSPIWTVWFCSLSVFHDTQASTCVYGPMRTNVIATSNSAVLARATTTYMHAYARQHERQLCDMTERNTACGHGQFRGAKDCDCGATLSRYLRLMPVGRQCKHR